MCDPREIRLCVRDIKRVEPENILRLFFPFARIEAGGGDAAAGPEMAVALGIEGDRAVCRVSADGFRHALSEQVTARPLISLFGDEKETAAARALYRLLSRLTGRRMPWGMITGVRPVKLMRRLVNASGEEAARAVFSDELFCSEEKIDLCLRTLREENRALALSGKASCSVYISVPFCPSRCAYCSFVSHTTERSHHLIARYVPLLCREIALAGEAVRKLGLKPETVYIGGGTPTALDAGSLEAVTGAIAGAFDVGSLREYTVEAGRPDTFTWEKMRVIAQSGATRISVNPQTLRDDVLQIIGRRHTAQDFFDGYRLARETGLAINTDIIAGLPGDTAEGFSQTLSGILALDPESVTVHTLCIKRGSFLADERADADTPRNIRESVRRLGDAGYVPYYLYRQSRCVGGQENTGWAKPGHAGLYNIFMTDETHTVIGCGAGAVTKLKNPFNEQLRRVFNFKYPYEYIDRFEEIVRRKAQIEAFYENLLAKDEKQEYTVSERDGNSRR